jgi:hypothetical protein
MESRTDEDACLDKRQIWEDRVARWQESGLTQKEFCRQNNLRENQLTYWKKRLFQPEAPVSFLQVQIAGNLGFERRSAIRLNIGHEYQVEIDPGFEPDVLKQVVSVLGRL